MKTALELYPNQYKEGDDVYHVGPYDYQPIIDSYGEILIQVDDEDYEGDTRVLLYGELGYGVLIFGWGSCSGCDSLQACKSYEEIDELIKDFYHDIKWFRSLETCQTWARNRDWDLQYSWRSDRTKEFVEKLINYKK